MGPATGLARTTPSTALWPQLSGPYVTVATVAAVVLLERMVPGLPEPTSVVLAAVVYAAFAGGRASGLFSAAVAVAYFAGARAVPGALLTIEPGAVPELALLAVVTPGIVLMVGGLKARAERVFELQAEQSRLRELDQLKTQFLNNAAHELRTPLTPIVLQLKMLRRAGAEMNEKQQQALDMVDRNIHRLNALVQDLLEVSKLQAGKLSLERRTVSLGDVAAEAVASFAEPARQAGLTVAYEPRGPDAAVDADPKRLIQVLFNLINNALKFTPAGGRIVVEVDRVGGEAEVRVRDTGTGLTPEQVGMLFQPFTQVHPAGAPPSAAHGGPGTGLGLYICRGIVEQHGGRIWAHSDGPGRGAVFTFRLPASGGPAAPGSPAAPRRAAVPGQAAGWNR